MAFGERFGACGAELAPWLVLVALGCACACAPEADPPQVDSRPSILLIVVDTLRADAVSAYGAREGTTPFIDELARNGVRYAHAYAPSSWTLPSHVSLFTGQRVDEHGVGLGGVKMASGGIETLAETLANAGYETAGFAENPVVGPDFGLDQGFHTYESPSIDSLADSKLSRIDPTNEGFGLVRRIEAWRAARDPSKPYFLFVNVFDPHYPFRVREENRFLPAGFSDAEVRYASQKIRYSHAICDRAPGVRDLEILRGLYLGDVAAADAKVERLLEVLGDTDRRRITILTSDHGEHLGEHRLLSHRFTVHDEALAIPLIVQGAEGMPGVVDSPVDLRGVNRSILCWAEVADCDDALPGPGDERIGSAPPLVSIYSDEVLTLPPEIARQLGFEEGYRDTARDTCQESDRVFGRMVAMVRYPLKMTWVQGQPARLHDLSWDAGELSDLIDSQTPEAAALRAEMADFLAETGLDRGYEADPDVRPLDPETAEALRGLGYID